MASYPSSIPSYAGFTGSDTLSHDNHAAQSNAQQSDTVAIATKLGTGASTSTNNTVLRGNGTGTTAFDQVHAATDISGVLPASNGGTGFTSTSAFVASILGSIYPVGCIYTETTGVNPATTFGFGTWSQTGQGRVLVGQGTSDQSFTAGVTGGESNHLLSSTEMPSHTHTITDPGHFHPYKFGSTAGGDGSAIATASTVGTQSSLTAILNATTGVTNQNTGGGGSHNNLQPYQVVYYWTRTA